MIGTGASPRRTPLELSPDRRFGRRVKRLAVVSSVVLGLISILAMRSLGAPSIVDALFLAGWLLMPTTLIASLWLPRLRYGLVVPASLVSVGLLVVCAGWLPTDPFAAAGWVLMTAGVALGGVLGLWFWFRLVPVPTSLDDPFSAGRWALIWVHVGLIVAGLALAATAL